MKLKNFFLFFLSVLTFSTFSCSSNEIPIEKIKKNLKDVKTYSIILEDMKEEGNFSAVYYHKYRVITPESGFLTEWIKVPEDYYKLNSGFLGMVLVNKKEGDLNTQVSPPGYEYVGDSRYGGWRTDSGGNSFWEFYGKYALLSNLMGGWYRPVYRNDYNAYRDHSRRNMVYYGQGNSSRKNNNTRYGTNGSVAKAKNPSFFERKQERQSSFKKKFQSNLNRKVGRTKTSDFRGKAGRIGK